MLIYPGYHKKLYQVQKIDSWSKSITQTNVFLGNVTHIYIFIKCKVKQRFALRELCWKSEWLFCCRSFWFRHRISSKISIREQWPVTIRFWKSYIEWRVNSFFANPNLLVSTKVSVRNVSYMIHRVVEKLKFKIFLRILRSFK